LHTLNQRFRHAFFLLVASVVLLTTSAAFADFRLPSGSEKGIWEAEDASGAGWNTVKVGKRTFVESRDKSLKGALEFSFELDQPSTIQVFPIWWRTGEQLPAKRFPQQMPCFVVQQVWPSAYPRLNKESNRPIPMLNPPGPDVIGYFGDKLFFTAPETSRVGILSMKTERIVGSIEIDGYPADLIVDRQNKRIYVADGGANLIRVFNAESLDKITEFPVPEFPRSIALHKGILYVSCMKAKAVVALDAESGKEKGRIALDIAAQHVEIVENKLILWPLFACFDPESGKLFPPDRLLYPVKNIRSMRNQYVRLNGPYNGVRSITYLDKEKRFYTSYGLITRMLDRSLPSKEVRVREKIDVSSVTSGAKSYTKLPPSLSDDPRPDAVEKVGNNLFFTSPTTGKVGVIYDDLIGIAKGQKNRLTKVIDVGGYVSDVVGFTGTRQRIMYLDIYHSLNYAHNEGKKNPKVKPKVYVSDALGNQVVVIDPDTCNIIKKIEVPELPVSLSVYGTKLYCISRAAKKLTIIDIKKDKIIKTRNLPGVPGMGQIFRIQAIHAATEMRTPASGTPLRLVINHLPTAYDPATLKEVEPPKLPTVYNRRVAVEWKKPGSTKAKKYFADNFHVLRVDGNRWINVGEITDIQLSREPARLFKGDTPGTISFSMDGGPATDWTRSVWVTPHRVYLQNGTDRFFRWNAPAFTLDKGRHTLRVVAGSPFARLDALRVMRTLRHTVSIRITPEPKTIHAKTPLPSYHGIFASTEPVRFSCEMKNLELRPFEADVKWTVFSLMGDAVDKGEKKVSFSSGGSNKLTIKPAIKRAGVYRLVVRAETPLGSHEISHPFSKMKKHSHPRLFFRRDEMGAIRRRIKKYPKLFARYSAWLRRQVDQKGFLPSKLYGTGHNQNEATARWRALSCIFAEMFLEKKGSDFYSRRIKKMITRPRHYYGAFQVDYQFGAAQTTVADLVAALSPEYRETIQATFGSFLKRRSYLSESLMAINEPLSPDERATLDRHMMVFYNYIRYFDAHRGDWGGSLWQDTRAGCQCTLHSMCRAFVVFKTYFNENRIFTKGFWSGLYTHYRYAMPRFDHKKHTRTGNLSNANPPVQWIAAGLSKNPLEKGIRGLDEVIKTLNGPLSRGEETKVVDELLGRRAHVVLPMFVALGWYDPKAPKTKWEDLPPSAVFEKEGTVAMKSDWSENMTDIYFTSGVRDTSYRVEPNHLQIYKGGYALLGSAAQHGDHGQPIPTWGNVVVVGKQWRDFWSGTGRYARMEERHIINRNAPAVLPYVVRDYRFSTVTPEGYPYFFKGGHSCGVYDIILHSHSRHPFAERGRILAYETSPAFDYVAGDASNAWPLKDVRDMARQVVYIRPDVIIVYDRVVLQGEPISTKWMARIVGSVNTKGHTFTVTNTKAVLAGQVLLPTDGSLSRSGSYISIRPKAGRKTLEYLVVMKTSMGTAKPLGAKLVKKGALIGARFIDNGLNMEVTFNKTGEIGGNIRLTGKGLSINRKLIEKVNPALGNWKEDPRYRKWTTLPGFKQLLPLAIRKNKGL